MYRLSHFPASSFSLSRWNLLNFALGLVKAPVELIIFKMSRMHTCILYNSYFHVMNFLIYRARWRENRTIFNTPNPRLMTVSLLREKKNERRGSREGSCKGLPSREPSMTSLRQHSPSIGSKNFHRFFSSACC